MTKELELKRRDFRAELVWRLHEGMHLEQDPVPCIICERLISDLLPLITEHTNAAVGAFKDCCIGRCEAITRNTNWRTADVGGMCVGNIRSMPADDSALERVMARALEAARSDLMECGHPRMFWVFPETEAPDGSMQPYSEPECSLCRAIETAVAERTKELQVASESWQAKAIDWQEQAIARIGAQAEAEQLRSQVADALKATEKERERLEAKREQLNCSMLAEATLRKQLAEARSQVAELERKMAVPAAQVRTGQNRDEAKVLE